ncbi:MAG: peroxiredoxin [Actinobacteria bacterium]|nr:peroxiredoxin [Actinomycetota bacterium]
MSAPKVGDEAPDFTLPGVRDGEEGTWTLSELRGGPVVLVFYPGDGTPVCTRQLNAYTSDMAAFAEVGASVLALSPQGVESHRAFAEKERGFAFPLLADEDKAVGGAYGVLGPLGFYRRSVFVVAPDGRIAWLHRATAGLTYRPASEIAAAVSAASSPG